MQESILGLTHLEVEKRREMGEGGNISRFHYKDQSSDFERKYFYLI